MESVFEPCAAVSKLGKFQSQDLDTALCKNLPCIPINIIVCCGLNNGGPHSYEGFPKFRKRW